MNISSLEDARMTAPSKRNGAMAWLLGISGALFTGLAVASFTLLLSMSGDVASIAASMDAMSARADRQDVRLTNSFDRLDLRLRDVELGER